MALFFTGYKRKPLEKLMDIIRNRLLPVRFELLHDDVNNENEPVLLKIFNDLVYFLEM